MRLTVEDIKKIKPGKTKLFILESNAACNTGRTLVYYVRDYCPCEGISGYTTTVDKEQHILSVTAIAKED
jgi:hypothetical protein